MTSRTGKRVLRLHRHGGELGTSCAARWPFLQNLFDGVGAAAAPNVASEAVVDLRGRAQLGIGRDDNIPDVAIADDIAGADDHA